VKITFQPPQEEEVGSQHSWITCPVFFFAHRRSATAPSFFHQVMYRSCAHASSSALCSCREKSPLFPIENKRQSSSKHHLLVHIRSRHLIKARSSLISRARSRNRDKSNKKRSLKNCWCCAGVELALKPSDRGGEGIEKR